MTTHPVIERYAEHVNPKLLGHGRVFVRAKGARVWDHEGREYLDFVAGMGAASLGHSPPRVVAALERALQDEAPNLMQMGPQPAAADLAAMLADRARPLTMCLFASSGSEAISQALKLARAATGKKALLYCRGGFHGAGMGALSVTGHGRLRDPFEPLVGQTYEVPFADLTALEAALKAHKCAALVTEPIQAEAGVVFPPTRWLAEARALCKRHGALFVLDEVQTGLGRTGRMFAYQDEGATPDVLVLGKALGGGMVPIAATLTTPEIHKKAFVGTDDVVGTYSGNTLACRAAIATLETLKEDDLVEAAATRGRRLLHGLKDRLRDHPLVRDVRGRGLLVAVELGPTESGLVNRLLPGVVEQVSKRVFGQWLALRLLEDGVLCQPALQQQNVLKLEPPLNVSEEDVDRVVDATARILDGYRDLRSLLADAGKRLGNKVLGGWPFGG
jgi:putrescine aminotransferase